MGIQSSQQPHPLEAKLKRQQQLNDPLYGWVQIFRSTQSPFEYIMKYKRKFFSLDDQYRSLYKRLLHFQNLQHKLLSKIHFVCQDKQVLSCTKTPTICCYINYYNFTLSKAIERRQQAKCYFNEADLWFLSVSLFGLAQYLKEQGIALSEYTAERIYLSPDGVPKVYILNVCSENKHNVYYRVLSDQDEFERYLLSPEQIHYLGKDEYEILFDIYKSDVFVIGLVILEMASLKKSNRYFNRNNKSILMSKIKQDINELISNYSFDFVNFLTKVLTENPNERPSFEQTAQMIKTIEQHSRLVRQSNSIKLSQTNQIVDKRKKALEIKRQQLEQQESSSQSIMFSASTTHPTSTKSIDKIKDPPIRKVSLLPLSNTYSSSRAFSAKMRDTTPLRKNDQKVSTLYKHSTFSLLDGPIKIPRRRFQ